MSHFRILHQTQSLVNVHMEHLVISGSHFDPGGEQCIPNFPLWVHPCIYPTWKYLHIVRRYFDGRFLLGTWVGHLMYLQIYGNKASEDLTWKRNERFGSVKHGQSRVEYEVFFASGTALDFTSNPRCAGTSMNFWFLTCSDTDNKSHWFQFNYGWIVSNVI